eukprot:CCRYP_010117-RA/>CCRYP_010117-RA protein AED:0.44 eAED:0.44 QI:66/1/1/1/0/0/2/17/89
MFAFKMRHISIHLMVPILGRQLSTKTRSRTFHGLMFLLLYILDTMTRQHFTLAHAVPTSPCCLTLGHQIWVRVDVHDIISVFNLFQRPK